MLHTYANIINAFTDIDEMIQFGNGPIMKLSPEEMFEMGQFYQWVSDTIDMSDESMDLNATTDVPEQFEWVIGETHGW